MGKDRLAAFSDGVIAILITIMVLELRIPHGADIAALMGVAPSFLTYVMSFVYLAIYWNNHRHLLHTVGRVDGLILWANSHLLFWFSLIPAATAWMGENLPAPLPTAVYGAVLLMPAIAYYLLQKAITHKHGTHSVLAQALGSDIKGKISPLLYLVGVVLAFVVPWLSIAIYVLVAVIWLIPDRRIERAPAGNLTWRASARPRSGTSVIDPQGQVIAGGRFVGSRDFCGCPRWGERGHDDKGRHTLVDINCNFRCHANFLRVCPDTLGRITKFSKHEPN